MELLFERFLSESRGEWPDIDLDLPSEEKREQAIQYVYQRYGELGAAMTANVITYRGKSAAREVGKALGFDQESLGRLSSLVSQWEWRGKTDTMAHSFQNAGFDLKHPRIAKYLELCMRIQDLPRHLGQHSGGMVICQGQLNPSCRWSERPCRAAPSSSGTRKTAPISASSRWICSASA